MAPKQVSVRGPTRGGRGGARGGARGGRGSRGGGKGGARGGSVTTPNRRTSGGAGKTAFSYLAQRSNAWTENNRCIHSWLSLHSEEVAQRLTTTQQPQHQGRPARSADTSRERLRSRKFADTNAAQTYSYENYHSPDLYVMNPPKIPESPISKLTHRF
jgi:hypothetical protein